MNDKNDNEMLESLKCPLCLDFAEDAMECTYCNNIFCKKCIGIDLISNLNKSKLKSCPICRKEPCSFQDCLFARRLLNNLPIICPNLCGHSTSRGEMKNHLNKCINKKYQCKICDLLLIKKEFLEHIKEKHEEEIIDTFNKLQIENLLTNKPIIEPVPKIIDLVNIINIPADINKINNVSLTNKKGSKVKLSANGMFYCGMKMEFRCECCDGNCGPDDGCNCISCMEMNCHVRNLAQGDLINKKGRVCQFSKRSYYCGFEYEKESTNIFKGVFKKKIKCNYPHDACPECQIITAYMKNYLSNMNYRKIMNI